MTETDYIISLTGVAARKPFLAELLAFYSPHEVVLTTWGKIPSEVEERLVSFRAPCSWGRRHTFHQSEWHLNPQSLPVLTQELCSASLLADLTWGLIKNHTPLGLCRSWGDMNLDGSDIVEEEALFKSLDDLKSKGLLQSYEKVTD